MNKDPKGVLYVASDGVLRSVAADGTVLDYHQLDPDQVESFAAHQLAVWQGSGMEVPESVKQLAKPPYPDGRLVTDKEQLLHPTDIPNLPNPPVANKRRADGETSPAEKRRQALEELNSPAKRQPACVGYPCYSLADCIPYGCHACYYPGGPPLGVCFLW